MHNKKICLIIILNLILFLNIFGQNNNTNSPYSRFGIGEIATNMFGQNYAMGGTSIGIRDPLHLNPNNPASYSSLDSSEVGAPFLFELGLTNKIVTLSTSQNTYTDNITNLNYVAFAFPYWKNHWYGSFGLKPYSNVGYKILSEENIENIGEIEAYYNGSGGINKVFSGHSFKFGKLVSIGFNANYLFGYLKQTNTLIFLDTTNQFNYQIEKNTRISDLYYNFGVQFHHTFSKTNSNNITNSHSFNVGFIFDNKTNISAKRDVLAGTILGYDNESILNNSIIDTLTDDKNIKGEITLPTSMGFGISYDYNKKLTIGIDYSMQNWSESLFFGVNDSLANSNRASFGIEYTPKRNNIQKGFGNLMKRISYRAGAHYSNTYLQFITKEEQINEFGIDFGFGIPIRKGRSSINLFFELKQRGTTDKNLIKEQFGTIGVNFTFYDIWFVKRKYD